MGGFLGLLLDIMEERGGGVEPIPKILGRFKEVYCNFKVLF